MRSLTIGQLSFVAGSEIRYVVLCSIMGYDFFLIVTILKFIISDLN